MSAGESDLATPSRCRPDLHLRRTGRCGAARRLSAPDRRPPRRLIPPGVEVLPGNDIDDLWSRFEVFEALHHTMRICNPMSSVELDELVSATEAADGAHVYDAACGYGELLVRTAAVAEINGTGIDLSPWMITTALAEGADRAPNASLRWILGEARDHRPRRPADVSVCIGAEWVWHDFAGTVRALTARTRAGGVVVVGAARLHHDADPAEVRRTHGRIDTIDDMADVLAANGLAPVHRIDPDDAGWDAYLARTADAARRWAADHPGERADRWIEEQADWQRARDRDRNVIGWSVWVARKASGRA